MRLAGEDLEALRLGYAQHVYRQQGATVERSVVVTGGWQTSRETAYVQASRAREGTEWFLARDELGTQGQDERRIESSPKRCEPAAPTPPRSSIASYPTPNGGRGSSTRSHQPAPAPGSRRGPPHANVEPDRARGWTR